MRSVAFGTLRMQTGALMMTIRYLASFEGVHCAAQINDQFGAFIAHTQFIPERNIYAAVLTRQQWDQVRAERWATGGFIRDGGILVPDVDFVASDGKVFLDFNECQQHESLLRMQSIDNPMVFPRTQATTDNAIEEIKKKWKEVPNEYRANFLPTYSIVLRGLGVTEPEKVLLAISNMQESAAAEITLESKILTAIGTTTMQVKLLASFLQVTEPEIREAVEKSPLLRFSTTGKSVAKVQ